MDQVFDGKKPTRLGTDRRPAMINVHTEERKTELQAVFDENGWACEITVNDKKPENTADLDILQNPVAPVSAGPKVGRNDPCPCGSGKKHKKCCGA